MSTPIASQFTSTPHLNDLVLEFLSSDYEIPYKQMQSIILAIIERHRELPESTIIVFIEFVSSVKFKQTLLLAPFYLHYLPNSKIGLIVLKPLVKLIVERNLSDINGVQIFPSFYKLLNDPNVLEKFKHKGLIAQLMLNSVLTDHQVNAFLKKFTRISVTTSSSSVALFLISLIYSLAQKYPKTKSLFHNEQEDAQPSLNDPYIFEDDLEKAQLVSLWEISLLLKHANPTVNRMASFFKTNFYAKTAKKINVMDFVALDDVMLFQKERSFGSKTGIISLGFVGDGSETDLAKMDSLWQS
jgi:CBF/Mak21 family